MRGLSRLLEHLNTAESRSGRARARDGINISLGGRRGFVPSTRNRSELRRRDVPIDVLDGSEANLHVGPQSKQSLGIRDDGRKSVLEGGKEGLDLAEVVLECVETLQEVLETFLVLPDLLEARLDSLDTDVEDSRDLDIAFLAGADLEQRLMSMSVRQIMAS